MRVASRFRYTPRYGFSLLEFDVPMDRLARVTFTLKVGVCTVALLYDSLT
jgi:hypothetical protein